MENSSILSIRSAERKLKAVVRKIKAAQLPIVCNYEPANPPLDGVMHFEYDGRCDGNTAHHLNQIIGGLIALYVAETLEEGKYDYDPIRDEHRQFTFDEFIGAAKEALDEYHTTFSERKNEYHSQTHTWSEWFNTFIGYVSW